MRNTFVNTVIESCRERKDIFIISGDAGLGVFDEFKKEFPERFLNLGVAEQNAASFSAGMALAGFKVYLYNIIPFVLYRCYEQVRNDICYQKLPVVLVGIGSGITYAPQGITHYSVEDLGLAQTLPNLTVISPGDPHEAKAAALYSLNAPGPLYVRLAKRGEPNIHNNEITDISLPLEISQAEEVALLFHGSIAIEAFNAADILAREGIRIKLVSLPMLQPLNVDKIFSLLEPMKYVFTVEEHFIHSGLGGILESAYVKRDPPWKLVTLGIPHKFIHEIRDTAGMRGHFGINAEKIAEFIKNTLRKGR